MDPNDTQNQPDPANAAELDTQPPTDDFDAAMAAAIAGDGTTEETGDPGADPAADPGNTSEDVQAKPGPAAGDAATPAKDGKPVETDEERARREMDEAIDAPIDGVPARTAARIERLKGYAKQARDREKEDEQVILEQNDRLAGWGELVQRTGMTPPEFADTMAVIGWANAGTPDQKREALKRIDVLRTKIAADIGEEAPGVDLLKPYPDLAAKVANDELTRVEAVEIANGRNLRQRQEQSERATNTQAQQQAQFQQDQAAAVQSINALGDQLRERDGAEVYAVRAGIAREVVLKQAERGLSPSQWREAMQDAYDAVPVEVVKGALASRAGGGAQPVRTPTFRGGAGASPGVQAEPGSYEDAMARAIAGG